MRPQKRLQPLHDLRPSCIRQLCETRRRRLAPPTREIGGRDPRRQIVEGDVQRSVQGIQLRVRGLEEGLVERSEGGVNGHSGELRRRHGVGGGGDCYGYVLAQVEGVAKREGSW